MAIQDKCQILQAFQDDSCCWKFSMLSLCGLTCRSAVQHVSQEASHYWVLFPANYWLMLNRFELFNKLTEEHAWYDRSSKWMDELQSFGLDWTVEGADIRRTQQRCKSRTRAGGEKWDDVGMFELRFKWWKFFMRQHGANAVLITLAVAFREVL